MNTEHTNLLRNAIRLDAKVQAEAAGSALPELPNQVYVPKATLFEDQSDEFGGNDNNRQVAERVAKNKATVEGAPVAADASPVPLQSAKPAKARKPRANAPAAPQWTPNA